MYDSLWADWYLPAAMPALEKLFFSRCDPGSAVLDVCCGSGHVTKEIAQRGYVVTGVDASAELISIARQRLPRVKFLIQDVTCLTFDRAFDAALSTFDSLNHILSIDQLRMALAGVRSALRSGGLFVFDMNLEKAYIADLHQWHVTMRETDVGLVRGTYDGNSKLARTELVWFVRQDGSDCWTRRQSVVEQRCYQPEQIIGGLTDAGFRSISAIRAEEAGITSELGFGRVFFSARA